MGVGSIAEGIRGRLVFAMKVEEAVTFDRYWEDDRFQKKKPSFCGSLKQAQGDNVYHRVDGKWVQERSRHTHPDFEMTAQHTRRDTSRNRVLVSKQYVYYGADAVELPASFEDQRGYRVCLDGTGTPQGVLQREKKFDDAALTERLEAWLEAEGKWGCVGEPCEWRNRNAITTMLEEETFNDPQET